jgi:hypothetical protein
MIYSQATCTIAATAAKDDDVGLFFDRSPTLLQPGHVEATWAPDPDMVENGYLTYPPAGSYWYDLHRLWTRAVKRTPLNSRAWMCHKLHLSPRIVHFSDKQLFWECYEGKASENYPAAYHGRHFQIGTMRQTP